MFKLMDCSNSRPVGSNVSLVRRRALCIFERDEIVGAQWHGAHSAPTEKQVQEVRHIGGLAGGPPPGKLDDLRSFLVQSWDETARFNNLLARLSILLVRRPPQLPHLLLRH